MAQCIPVIMSGGAGTRLWPASRRDRPKQFLPLVTERSMFTETLARVPEGPLYAAPIIVGSAAHDTLIRGALDSAGVVAQHILLEPEGRNTAAAICLAALQIGEKDMGAAMLVLPSDHVVADKTAFDAAIQTAITAALDGAIVTFGIVPDGPETGYGYIEPETRAPAVVLAFTVSPKSPIVRPPKHGWQRAAIAGTAVFSCLRLKAFWPKCKPIVLKFLPHAVQPSPAHAWQAQ